MSLIAIIKDIFTLCLLLLLSMDTTVRAKIITYTNYCNKTITIGEINDVYAGIINFKYSQPVGNNDTFICIVKIVTAPGSQISATFTDDPTRSNEWGTLRTCDTRMIVPNTVIVYKIQYWCSLPREEIISTNSYLNILFQSTGSANVKMIFNTFSYCGKQGQRDVMCNNRRCIDHSLVCATSDNFCRDDTDLCSSDMDGYKSGVSVSTISGIVFTVLGIIVTFGIVVTIFRRRKEATRPVVRTAADVFVVRTSDDTDGRDVSPIDPRTFDLPPEYSSLENLAGIGDSREDVYNTIAEKTEDLPPDYQAVIANATEYKVTLHI